MDIGPHVATGVLLQIVCSLIAHNMMDGCCIEEYNGGGDYAPPKTGSQSSGCVGNPDYQYVEKF